MCSVSGLDELQEIGIDRVRVCRGHAVREAFVRLQRRVRVPHLHQLRMPILYGVSAFLRGNAK